MSELKISTIEIKISEMLAMEAALSQLGQTRGLNPKVAYRIARLLKKLAPEFEQYAEARNEIIKSYGEPDEKGQTIIEKDKIPEFNARVKELTDEMVRFDFIKLDLETIEKAELSAYDLGNLNPILNDPDAELEASPVAA